MRKIEVLEFYIKGQTITPQYNNVVLAEKSIGYLKAKFIFDEEDWEDLQKVAIFEQNKKLYFYLIENEEAFLIPSAALKVPGFKVSVFGTDTAVLIDENGKLKNTTLKKRITTYPIGVSLRIAGPMDGEIYNELNDGTTVAENAAAALKIAKEAYTLFWNMEESLEKIYEELGGDREKELLNGGSM